jgi:hypothetical protein
VVDGGLPFSFLENHDLEFQGKGSACISWLSHSLTSMLELDHHHPQGEELKQ